MRQKPKANSVGTAKRNFLEYSTPLRKCVSRKLLRLSTIVPAVQTKIWKFTEMNFECPAQIPAHRSVHVLTLNMQMNAAQRRNFCAHMEAEEASLRAFRADTVPDERAASQLL